ncbi:unnamed protein product [Spodoptera littoralis]|uniref:Secreted protein n=1 Tax=Spodoptera littoralis TaxID=7109 RepID=A0A9P0ICR0_SPOLI|nr:unnamed protein product [Spodoptera littoralis]CAH1644338.1 unnamed protein product [Spodoptera littoralis]
MKFPVCISFVFVNILNTVSPICDGLGTHWNVTTRGSFSCVLNKRSATFDTGAVSGPSYGDVRRPRRRHRRPPPNTNDILHTISTTFFTEQDAKTLHLHGIIESTHMEQHSQRKLITCMFTAETFKSDDKSKCFKAL